MVDNSFFRRVEDSWVNILGESVSMGEKLFFKKNTK